VPMARHARLEAGLREEEAMQVLRGEEVSAEGMWQASSTCMLHMHMHDHMGMLPSALGVCM
jgi:hypothetical protein